MSKESNIYLEACCTSPEQARRAINNGVSRIELCRSLEVGGITPEPADIAATVALGLPVNVLVRPRGGNFVFSPEEEETMHGSITACRELGAAGVVIGALTSNGDVDVPMMQRLINTAKGMSVTFHRAFDECREPFTALEQIIDLGCDRILTSGQQQSAWLGRELISRLVLQARGRIIIMPGAGITPNNLSELIKATGAVEYHGSAFCTEPQSRCSR